MRFSRRNDLLVISLLTFLLSIFISCSSAPEGDESLEDSGQASEVEDNMNEEGMEEDGMDCSALSTAGTINKIFMILSLISIIVLLIFSTGRGFGIFSSGILDEKSELIEKISWVIAVASINLGTLLYWMIVGFQSHFEDSEEGLGSMWWMMFLFSLTFAAIVYNERVKSLVSRFRNSA